MKYYFKVWIDFNQYIPIDETELEKALYAFQSGKPVIFEMGAASRIQSIVPDFNKALGWYSDYKPHEGDAADLDSVKPAYRDYLSAVKEKVQYLVSKGQTHLIGKSVDISELESPKVLTKEMK